MRPPLLLNSSSSKTVPTVVSILVAISAALLKYFKFDEWGRIHRLTALRLDNELEDYQLGSGQYRKLDKDEAFYLFRKATAKILGDHMKQVNNLHRQSHEQGAGQSDKADQPE